MHTLPEVGHQVAEGAQLPALVQPVEAFRHAVVRGRDLVGVDRVQFLPWNLWIPEDERPAPNQVAAPLRPLDRPGRRPDGRWGARLTTRGLDRVQEGRDEPILSSRSTTASAASVVLRAPPRSLVVRRSAAADITAFSIWTAPASSPRCRSIIAPARIAPTGLAMPLPACLGAEPCTGSKSPRR